MNEIAEEMIHREEGFIPNEDAASEQKGLTCPKCSKIFKNAVALRMHDIRKHQNRGWDTSHNFGKQSREQMLAKKRKYNRKWRLSRGMKVRPASLKGPKWSPQRRKKFQSRNHEAQPQVVKPVLRNNPGVTFCPQCGCNIKIVAAAIAFGDKQ